MTLFRKLTSVLHLALLFPFTTLAGPLSGGARLDSLLREVPIRKADTPGVQLLQEIAWEYEKVDLEEGYKWAQRHLKAAKEIGWRRGEAYAYASIGNYLTDQGKPEEALKNLLHAQSILKAIGDTRNSRQLLNQIGTVYLYQNNYQQALLYYTGYLHQAQAFKEDIDVEIAYTNIGMAYDGMREYKKALHYMGAAFQKAEKRGDPERIRSLSAAIANVFAHQKDISSAIGWEAKSLYLAFQLGYPLEQSINWGNLGSYFYQAALYDSTPNDNLMLTKNPHINLIWATTFLEMAFQKSKVLGHTRSMEVWKEVLEKARLFQAALRQGPIKPADIHLYM